MQIVRIAKLGHFIFKMIPLVFILPSTASFFFPSFNRIWKNAFVIGLIQVNSWKSPWFFSSFELFFLNFLFLVTLKRKCEKKIIMKSFQVWLLGNHQ